MRWAHVWTAPVLPGKRYLIATSVGRGHVSGLLLRGLENRIHGGIDTAILQPVLPLARRAD